MKKITLCLTLINSLMLASSNLVLAKGQAMGFEEVIAIALKENFDVLIAENARRTSLLSNSIATLHVWLPKATFVAAQENKWEKDTESFYFQSNPLFTLTWELKSVFDKIFQTKINAQHNIIDNLAATKTISNELQKVIICYYELALAQNKCELSDTFIKIAASRLDIERDKFSLGFTPKINYLNAALALKEAKLSLLKEQEALKEKRRNLNLMLSRPLDQEILVESSIPVEPTWDMHAATKEKVVNVEAAIQEKKVALAATKLTRAKAYPLSCLSLSSDFFSNGYTYNFKNKLWHNSPSSIIIKIGVTIDIGSLLLMPTEIKKARIALDNEQFKFNKEKLSVEDHLENQKWIYRHALEGHKIAAERLNVSRERLAFIQESYQVNQVSLLDLQEAEENVQKSAIDLITYAFKVKQAEFALYRLVGLFDK